MDTIFATSSGRPPAAIAIIRLSGTGALNAAKLLAGSLPPARVAGVRALHDPRDCTLLDRALVLAFDGPRTATGEDVVELHVHGGRAVVAAVEDALARLPGLRRAKAGEFTRRALANGRIDLTEAEGLGDLLAAETEVQRIAALRVAEGSLRATIEHWTDRLVAIAARLEALLDFSDEDDVTAVSLGASRGDLRAIAAEVEEILRRPPVERLRDGIRVVLAGPPNSGKSTLFNALAERDVAIVSEVSGTTRDRIDAPVIRRGIAYVLTDTAGLADDSDDPIERIGIARARQAAAAADIVLWLGDDLPLSGAIWVYPRADLPERRAAGEQRLAISATTGVGLEALWDEIARLAGCLLPSVDQVTVNVRQRTLLSDCSAALLMAEESDDPLLVAEDLRVALLALDQITGRADVENVLDALFAGFCIGK